MCIYIYNHPYTHVNMVQHAPKSCGYKRTGVSHTCFTKQELTSFLKKRESDNIPRSDIGKYKKLLRILGVQDDDGIIKEMELDPNVYRKPPMPELLLSNEDINYILLQYESAHPGFKSFGSVPYDFSERPPGPWKKHCTELHNLDWGTFLESYSSFGMVVNLDTHTKPGNHWVCVFVEVSGANNHLIRCEYFDSLGTSKCRSFVPKCNNKNVPYRIHTLFNRLSKSFDANGFGKNTIYVSQNKDTHQKKNNECGMYCLYYLYNRLNGVPYDDGVHTISDDKMTYFRNVLFDHTDSVCNTCGKLSLLFKESKKMYGEGVS
jgi:hypothetical protein